MIAMAKVITSPLHLVQRGPKRAFSTAPLPGPVHRPARVAVMLALAHKLSDALADGKMRSRTEIAQRLRVSNAAVTQLLALLQLAPDLQERVLFLDAVDGVEPTTSRSLRPVITMKSWAEQRVIFEVVVARSRGIRDRPRGQREVD